MDAGPRRAGLTPKRILSWAVTIIVLAAWGNVLAGQLGALAQLALTITPLAIGLAIVFGSLHIVALAVCWSLVQRQMAAHVRLDQAVQAWVLSTITRYVPGNIWHVLARVSWSDRLQLKPDQILASTAVEQVLTLLGALALAAATAAFWAASDQSAPSPIWLALPAGLALLHPGIMGRLLRWAARRFNRPSLEWSFRYRDILTWVLGYGLTMAISGLALVALAGQYRAPSLADGLGWLGMAAMAWAAGYLSFLTPSGLGVREGVMTALLAQTLPLPEAIALSLTHRIALTLGELVTVAGVALWRRALRPQDADQA